MHSIGTVAAGEKKHTGNTVSLMPGPSSPRCSAKHSSSLLPHAIRYFAQGLQPFTGGPAGKPQAPAAMRGPSLTCRASLSQKACLSPQHIQQRSCQFIFQRLVDLCCAYQVPWGTSDPTPSAALKRIAHATMSLVVSRVGVGRCTASLSRYDQRREAWVIL